MNNEIIKPSPSERKLAREFCELLEEIQTPIHFSDADRMAIRMDYHAQMLVIPKRFFEQFMSMMKCLATGGTVCIFQFEEMVTTQKAAEILNMSRPHLVKLLEKGEIPFVKAGSHRKIQIADIYHYRHKIQQFITKNNLGGSIGTSQELELPQS